MLLIGTTPVLDLRDRDKLLRGFVRNRNRSHPAPRNLPDRRLDVVRVVVASVHDEQIFNAADDEQFTIVNNPLVSGPQPGTFRRARRGRGKPCTERSLGLLGIPPISDGHVVAMQPDFADDAGGVLGLGFGVDDPHQW